MSRLFFALVPDKEIINELNLAVNVLKPTGTEKVVANDKLHLTLRYIGSASDQIRNAIIQSVNKTTNSSFTLNIDKQAYWNKPKISVLMPNSIPSELTALVEALESICIENGLPKDNRQYKPHITVIRNTNDQRPEMKLKTISWHIRDFVLLNSETINGKLQYTEIGRWVLDRDE